MSTNILKKKQHERRLSEAEMEMDRNSWEMGYSDNNLSHKDWSCITRISGLIKLKWKTSEILKK